MEELQLIIRPFCNDPVQCGDCVPHSRKIREALANYRRALKFIKKSFPKTTIVWQNYIAASVFYWKSSTKMKCGAVFGKSDSDYGKTAWNKGRSGDFPTSLALIELKWTSWKRRKSISTCDFAFKEMAARRIHTTAQRLRTRRGLLPSGQSGTRPGKL